MIDNTANRLSRRRLAVGSVRPCGIRFSAMFIFAMIFQTADVGGWDTGSSSCGHFAVATHRHSVAEVSNRCLLGLDAEFTGPRLADGLPLKISLTSLTTMLCRCCFASSDRRVATSRAFDIAALLGAAIPRSVHRSFGATPRFCLISWRTVPVATTAATSNDNAVQSCPRPRTRTGC